MREIGPDRGRGELCYRCRSAAIAPKMPEISGLRVGFSASGGVCLTAQLRQLRRRPVPLVLPD